MKNLTYDRLKDFERDPLNNFLTRSEMMEVVRELISIREAQGVPDAEIKWDGTDFTVQNVRDGFSYGITPVFTAPQLPVVPEWNNAQCLEFLSVAFRHNNIDGEIEFDDIRLGVKFALSAAQKPGGE